MVSLTATGQQLLSGSSGVNCLNDRHQSNSLNALVTAWHLGDRAAGDRLCSALFSTVQSSVDHYLNRRFRLRADVADVVQDVFLDMLKKFRGSHPQFKSTAAFKAWVWRYARHKVLKRISRESAAKRAVDRESRTRDGESLETYITDYRVARSATLENSRERLLRALAVVRVVDPTCYQVLRMMQAGTSQIEIAKRLNVTTRTIRRKMEKIRAICR